MRDGGEDDDVTQGEGKKVKLSGRSGSNRGIMVEQLIGSVHRLSVASLASMAAADRRGEVMAILKSEHYCSTIKYL